MEPEVLHEERRWDQIVAETLSEKAELLSVSRWVPDSRAYAEGNQVAVIRIIPSGAHPTLGNAARAHAALSAPHNYLTGEGWEALVVARIEGGTLESLIPFLKRRERAALLAKLVPELRRLHARGVAHCDLRPDNLLVTPGGKIALVDFDRALVTGPRRAALADWLGLGARGPAAKPFWKLVLLALEPRTRSAYLRLRARLPSATRRHLPDDPDLQLLAQAWTRAAASGANAPGQGVAYYALTYKGFHLPGERSWYQRWDPIRRRVDFQNKRVLELGCNMGLLSSFALLHGAADARGVDRDESILDAARLAARALGADPEFQQVDLAGAPDWEDRLAGADVVTAMSLVHWLPEPERVLRFLGEHSEVVYEGHDPLSVERERLRAAGFTQIEVLSRTERGRELLYAHR